MKLTREDVTVHTENHPTPMPPKHVAWHIEVAGEHFQIVSRPDTEWGNVTHAFRADPRGWTTGADGDLMSESQAFEGDHWACIDRLLTWLSIDVEDGWSRPVNFISHRVDLEPVEIVALFTVRDRCYTELWDARSMGSHFESYRYDEGDDDAVYKEHPARLYVRIGDELREAQCDRLRSGDDYEVRVFVDGEIVAAARY